MDSGKYPKGLQTVYLLTQSNETQKATKKPLQQKSFSAKWSGLTTTGALLSGSKGPTPGGQNLVMH